MNIRELTHITFDDFIKNAQGIFEPVGTSLHLYRKHGKNTETKNEFTNGRKPEWYRHGIAPIVQAIYKCNKSKHPLSNRFFRVRFDHWNDQFDITTPPLRFAFEQNMLYTSNQNSTGTPEFPYEQLYIRQF